MTLMFPGNASRFVGQHGNQGNPGNIAICSNVSGSTGQQNAMPGMMGLLQNLLDIKTLANTDPGQTGMPIGAENGHCFGGQHGSQGTLGGIAMASDPRGVTSQPSTTQGNFGLLYHHWISHTY